MDKVKITHMSIRAEILLLSGITILAYLASAMLIGFNLTSKHRLPKVTAFSLGLLAIVLHAIFLHLRIDLATGQNLSFVNMFSLVVWLIALLTLGFSLRKPIENLLLLIFPVATFSILLMLIFPEKSMINTAADPKQLIHILLAVLTFSVLCIAGLQAILLALQEQQLRSKYKSGIFKKFPPLETMESLLFQMIWLGFILLSLMIGTSLYFFYDRVTLPLVQKIILAFIAWIIFGILLLGRYYYGWRGRKAIYGTLIGVLLILIIYFGSILLLQAFI